MAGDARQIMSCLPLDVFANENYSHFRAESVPPNNEREGEMDYLDVKSTTGADPQAVLGATLCMMSCSMQSGCTIYLGRIVENLEWLAAAQPFDKDFRRLCRRLAAHWDAVVEQALQANESIASFNKALH
jgi:hypothetical protein